MSRLLFCFLLHLVVMGPSVAQDRFHVGFADTLLFNDSLRYTAFGYDGPAPLFVQTWFPVEESLTAQKLSFQQLRDRRLEQPVQQVYNELLSRMDSAFIEYDLRYPIGGDEPIDYAPFTEQQVKDSLFVLPTRARRIPFPERVDHPVIVYHHGSQGFSDENVAMAQNFATWGFVFLSCNFHWPLEGKPYGTPLEWKPDRLSIRTMLRFARVMNSRQKVYYIGHSWGAQEGWCTLHEPGLADAFVSLETTMEWKTDTAEVRDKWPDMLEAITTSSYPMPILMVADSDGRPPYPLFNGVRGDLHYLDPKQPFAHEGYRGANLYRVVGDGRFPVPDVTQLWQQNTVYVALFGELLDFLRIRSGMPAFLPERGEDDPFHRYPASAPISPAKH
jgi:pimeloyl-ACP methyl ester carboxylesterase